MVKVFVIWWNNDIFNYGYGHRARQQTYYSDIIMDAMTSQITGVSIVCLAVFQAQIKDIKAPRHRPLRGESTSDRWISPTKGPVTRKLFPFDDVITR